MSSGRGGGARPPRAAAAVLLLALALCASPAIASGLMNAATDLHLGQGVCARGGTCAASGTNVTAADVPTDRLSPAPASAPSACSAGGLGDLGVQVAPLPAADSSPPPFGVANNTFSTRLIRLSPEQAARPVPTAAWFTNLIYGGPEDNRRWGEDPVQAFPYYITVRGPPSPTTAAADRGLWFCKPYYTGDNGDAVMYGNWPELQFTFRELQESASPDITVPSWDDLTVTVNFSSGDAAPGALNASMSSPVALGSPFVTVRLPSPARPVLRAPRAGAGGASIESVERAGPSKLRVVLSQVPVDGQHTWLIYSSSPIGFSFDVYAGEVAIWDAAGAPGGTFSGALRAAWAPNAGDAGDAAVEALLDAHAGAVAVGGSVAAWASPSAGSYTLSWDAEPLGGGGDQQELLMLAMPHHVDTLAAAPPSAFPLGVAPAGSPPGATNGTATYDSSPAGGEEGQQYGAYVVSLRGPLVPVAGSCWLLQEPLAPLPTEMDEASGLRSPEMRAAVEQTLLDDVQLVVPGPDLPPGDPFARWPAVLPGAWPWQGQQNVDVYFGGSEMAAMARLVRIARALEATAPGANSTFGPAAAAAAASVANALKLLMQHKFELNCTFNPPGGDPNYGAFCYDTLFKLVTTSRAQSYNLNDGVDFDSRVGGDHHFHYGYWSHAAATVATEDPAFYQQHLKPYMDALVRDFANNAKDDVMFPFARHKSWYEGHSYAQGLENSGDGKDQESSSEAVAAYYALAALGTATGDAVRTGWGRLLMAMEVRSAQKYWQSWSKNDIYPQVAGGSPDNAISRQKVVGILYAGKASAANFFFPDILTRHGIQWLPFSPASPLLLPRGWIEEAWPLVAANTTIPTDQYWTLKDPNGGAMLGWRVLLTMAQAVLPGQQQAAWDALGALPIDANGGYALCGPISRQTRTAARWWIATQSP